MKQLAKKINTKLVTNDNTRKDYFKTPLYFSWWRSGKQQETKGNHPSDIQSVWMDFLKSEKSPKKIPMSQNIQKLKKRRQIR